jgi:hypothetical protein
MLEEPTPLGINPDLCDGNISGFIHRSFPCNFVLGLIISVSSRMFKHKKKKRRMEKISHMWSFTIPAAS